MQFHPCVSGRCTEQGTHCEGCGRSHAEIAETKGLVMEIVRFAQRMGYENVDDFAAFIGQSVANKLKRPS